jgi:hypothetical protein
MDRMEVMPRRQIASGYLSASILGSARPLTARRRSGCEESCDFCGGAIGRLSPEFEVEADFDGERWRLHFHSRCYYAWWGARPGTSGVER